VFIDDALSSNMIFIEVNKKGLAHFTNDNVTELDNKGLPWSLIDRHLLLTLLHFTKPSSDTTVHQSRFSFNKFNHLTSIPWQDSSYKIFQIFL
jgi:hypothetical protein